MDVKFTCEIYWHEVTSGFTRWLFRHLRNYSIEIHGKYENTRWTIEEKSFNLSPTRRFDDSEPKPLASLLYEKRNYATNEINNQNVSVLRTWMSGASCPCRPWSPHWASATHTQTKRCGPVLYTANKVYSGSTKLYWQCQPYGKSTQTRTHTHKGPPPKSVAQNCCDLGGGDTHPEIF